MPASHGGEQKWQKSKREPSHVTSKPSTIASERRGGRGEGRRPLIGRTRFE